MDKQLISLKQKRSYFAIALVWVLVWVIPWGKYPPSKKEIF